MRTLGKTHGRHGRGSHRSALFWNESNWQALCRRCHNRKTAATGYTNAAGASPTVFSVMKKLVSDAWKMRSASEKSVLVANTMFYTTKTIVLIVETMVFAFEKIVFVIEKIVFVAEKIVFVVEKIVFVVEKIVFVIEKIVFVVEKKSSWSRR
jgi:positive regulator of sigma E activity